MPPAPKATSVGRGPHLNIAAICETVLTEDNGVISLIRIVDTITQAVGGPEPPPIMPPFMLQGLNIVIGLRADKAKGLYKLEIVSQPPGKQMTMRIRIAAEVELEPGATGSVVAIPLQVPITEPGIHWFDIYLTRPKGAQRHLTRLPLEVLYEPQTTVQQ